MLLLEQFRSFYYRNYPNDMESAIELFSIFGGLDITLDVTKHKHQLIKEIILDNFNVLDHYVTELLAHNRSATRLLRALSVGDRRIFSSFKKARLNNQNGGMALHFLQEKGLLSIEYSREQDKREIKPKLSKEEARHRISDKFLFTYPFIRFWFYFIYPHANEIAKGEYHEVLKAFEKQKNNYTSLVFEELSRVLLNYHLRDETIETIGSYWDPNVEIDVLVITKTKSSYVAECKWTNHKINKKELNKLIEKCEIIHIHPKQYILFSKRGFSKELINMQGSNLALFSAEDFKWLIKTKPSSMVFPLCVALENHLF
jgi:hypothetical protein